MKTIFATMFAAAIATLAGCSTPERASTLQPGSAPGNGDLGVNKTGAGRMLDRMIGKWVLHGTIRGMETTHDIDADWALDREYVRIHEVSRERNAKGGPAYEAMVFIGYDSQSGEYSCLWLDTTLGGGLSSDSIGRGKLAGDSIPFVFKTSDGNVFHSTFIYDGDAGSWRWVMDSEQDGRLKPFARVTLLKKT